MHAQEAVVARTLRIAKLAVAAALGVVLGASWSNIRVVHRGYRVDTNQAGCAVAVAEEIYFLRYRAGTAEHVEWVSCGKVGKVGPHETFYCVCQK
jgi:hypothetical protein